MTSIDRNGGSAERRIGETSVTPTRRPAHPPTLWLALTFLLLMSIAPANAINDKAGTSAGSFLKIPTDARGVALGPAIVSMAEGAEGMRWNPASLGRIESQEFSATHIEYYQDVVIENVTYARPYEESALAANIFYLSPGDLEGRDLDGARTGDFTFYDLVASVGYGRRVKQLETGADLYIGGAFKIVQEKIADVQYQNPALDAGLLLVPNETLKVGVALRNLSFGKADFPKELTGGASYTFMRVFTAGAAATYTDDAPIRYGVAGEYRFPELQNTVIRGGYHTHDELDDSLDSKIHAFRSESLAGVTMGAGFEYRPLMFKTLRLNFDYGMAPFGSLGIAHTLTVKARW